MRIDLTISFFLHSAKGIDEYANFKIKAAETNDKATEVDPRLEAIVERMLDKYVNSTAFLKKQFWTYVY